MRGVWNDLNDGDGAPLSVALQEILPGDGSPAGKRYAIPLQRDPFCLHTPPFPWIPKYSDKTSPFFTTFFQQIFRVSSLCCVNP